MTFLYYSLVTNLFWEPPLNKVEQQRLLPCCTPIVLQGKSNFAVTLPSDCSVCVWTLTLSSIYGRKPSRLRTESRCPGYRLPSGSAPDVALLGKPRVIAQSSLALVVSAALAGLVAPSFECRTSFGMGLLPNIHT